jgi:L-seryl-tRNA(Ser) seleniumtransferase
MILRVHPSNFKIVGFTEAPTLAELVALAREARLPLLEDLGSGLLGPAPEALTGEPRPEASLHAGVDVVTFSGDKLLGGPQAGLAVGHGPTLGAMRGNPLYRALRVDKMTMAALDAVLADHERGDAAAVPVLRMLHADAAEVGGRASALVEALRPRLPGVELALRAGTSAVGGGAAPDVEVPTMLLSVGAAGLSAERLAARLREGTPPVVARVAQDRVWIDMRTVLPDEDALLRDALLGALAR